MASGPLAFDTCTTTSLVQASTATDVVPERTMSATVWPPISHENLIKEEENSLVILKIHRDADLSVESS